MFNQFRDAAEYVKKEGIELVDLLYSDLWGHLHHLTLSSREFTPLVMSEGVGFDGSSVGFKHVQAGDMVLIPDLGTGLSTPSTTCQPLHFYATFMRLTPRSYTCLTRARWSGGLKT